ncbi:MAG: hypothetical protein KGY76_08840 [Candidatus Thermoplasmatota archaeon]|nr:hypothetical protein [Candidatus Thermoplasmatota archaeon]
MNRKVGIIMVIAVVFLLASAIGLSTAGVNSDSSSGSAFERPRGTGDGDCDGEPKMRMLDRFNLTEEQKEEIIDKVKSMREDGADRDEIRDTVIEMLEDYGVDVPEDMGEGSGEKHRRGRGRGDCEK